MPRVGDKFICTISDTKDIYGIKNYKIKETGIWISEQELEDLAPYNGNDYISALSGCPIFQDYNAVYDAWKKGYTSGSRDIISFLKNVYADLDKKNVGENIALAIIRKYIEEKEQDAHS